MFFLKTKFFVFKYFNLKGLSIETLCQLFGFCSIDQAKSFIVDVRKMMFRYFVPIHFGKANIFEIKGLKIIFKKLF
jgi:hypothetical protein